MNPVYAYTGFMYLVKNLFFLHLFFGSLTCELVAVELKALQLTKRSELLRDGACSRRAKVKIVRKFSKKPYLLTRRRKRARGFRKFEISHR